MSAQLARIPHRWFQVEGQVWGAITRPASVILLLILHWDALRHTNFALYQFNRI